MSIDDDIPREVHPRTTQFIRVEKGCGIAEIGNKKVRLTDNVAIIIPAGTKHYIKNTGHSPLKLYTIYSPPEHPRNLIERAQ